MRKLLTKLSSMLVAAAMVVGMVPAAATSVLAATKTYSVTLSLDTEVEVEAIVSEGDKVELESYLDYDYENDEAITYYWTVSVVGEDGSITLSSSEDDSIFLYVTDLEKLWDLENYEYSITEGESSVVSGTIDFTEAYSSDGSVGAWWIILKSTTDTPVISIAIDIETTETIESYTVTFDPDNGEETYSVEVTSGTKITSALYPYDDPVKEGYTFRYWRTKTDDGYAALLGSGTYTVTGDVTFTAYWVEDKSYTVNVYLVIQDADGNEVESTADPKVSAGDTTEDGWTVASASSDAIVYTTTISATETAGFDFTLDDTEAVQGYWDLSDYAIDSVSRSVRSDGAHYSTTDGDTTATVEISRTYGSYYTFTYTVVLKAEYTVTYVVGNEEVGSESVTDGNEIEIAGEVAAPEGQYFVGWVLDPDDDTEEDIYEAGASYTVTEDVTFYALFADNEVDDEPEDGPTKDEIPEDPEEEDGTEPDEDDEPGENKELEKDEPGADGKPGKEEPEKDEEPEGKEPDKNEPEKNENKPEKDEVPQVPAEPELPDLPSLDAPEDPELPDLPSLDVPADPELPDLPLLDTSADPELPELPPLETPQSEWDLSDAPAIPDFQLPEQEEVERDQRIERFQEILRTEKAPKVEVEKAAAPEIRELPEIEAPEDPVAELKAAYEAVLSAESDLAAAQAAYEEAAAAVTAAEEEVAAYGEVIDYYERIEALSAAIAALDEETQFMFYLGLSSYTELYDEFLELSELYEDLTEDGSFEAYDTAVEALEEATTAYNAAVEALEEAEEAYDAAVEAYQALGGVIADAEDGETAEDAEDDETAGEAAGPESKEGVSPYGEGSTYFDGQNEYELDGGYDIRVDPATTPEKR